MSLLDDIDTYGLTPAIQRNVFLQLLRAKFASVALIRDPYLKQYLWTASTSSSKILIEVSERFKLEDLGLRPAVILVYGGSAPIIFSMRDGFIKKNIDTNVEYRSFWFKSSFSIRCVSGESNEAISTASEIFIRFLENLPTFKDAYGFKSIDIGQMSGASKVKEFKDNWVVTIPIETTVEHESYIDRDTLPERLGEDYDIG